jgi:malate dehydrogenase
MPLAAILGAGPLGGALAHRLAASESFDVVRLVDDAVDFAAGQALDIMQTGALEGFHTRLDARALGDSLSGASLVIVADRVGPPPLEWHGEAGLAMLAMALRTAADAPILFAGSSQTWLMERAAAELGAAPHRLIGSAPLALAAAFAAMTALECDAAATAVEVAAFGRPPDEIVVDWEGSRVGAQSAIERLGPTTVRRVERRVRDLWPPGPYALASAATVAASAIARGTRREITCLVIRERARSSWSAVALPSRLGPRGVERTVVPVLTGRARERLHRLLAGDQR